MEPNIICIDEARRRRQAAERSRIIARWLCDFDAAQALEALAEDLKAAASLAAASAVRLRQHRALGGELRAGIAHTGRLLEQLHDRLRAVEPR